LASVWVSFVSSSFSRLRSRGGPVILDRLSSETTPQGGSTVNISYTWDKANRLNGIYQGSGGCTSTGNPAVGFAYDNASRRTTLTLPNGVPVSYSYDKDSRVTLLNYGTGSTQLGQLSYYYDADGRVTGEGGTLASISLPQSINGNMFNADNAMPAFGLQTLAYDANGNLTSDGTNAYSWDARNHLSAISGTVSASFTYDALGRRAGKTIGGATRQFVYDRLNSRPGVGWSQPTQHHGEPAHRTGN
jgi:uncharacterized protein RhaS with RHS repeats